VEKAWMRVEVREIDVEGRRRCEPALGNGLGRKRLGVWSTG